MMTGKLFSGFGSVPASVLTILLCACSFDTPALEEGYNDEHVRIVDIRATAIATDGQGNPIKVRPFGGYDASPIAPEGQLLGAYYQRAGIKMARFPVGWKCDLTMDAIFPNEFADPDDDDAYQAKALDDVADHLVKYGILPVWQAAWDVGSGGCSVTPTIGIASRPVSDTDLWARVAAHRAYKLNTLMSRYYNEEMLAKLTAVDMKAGYVEFLPDPSGAGGFGDLGARVVLPVFNNFMASITSKFSSPEAKERLIGIIGPGMKISDAGEFVTADSDSMEFITAMAQNPARKPDIFSIKPEVDSIGDLVAIVHGARDKLDDNGLTNQKLGLVGLSLTPATWEALDSRMPGIPDRSAWMGAFSAAAYIRLQEDIFTVIPQRWSTFDRTEEAFSGEDLFQMQDGSTLPAIAALTTINTFFKEGAEVIRVDNADPTDFGPESTETKFQAGDPGDDLSVLAARRSAGGYEFLVAAVNPPTVDRTGHRIRYVLNITDIPDGTSGWSVQIAEVDSTSTRFKPVARDAATVDDGRVSISAYITSPAIHMIRFAPPASIDDTTE